MFDNEVFLRSTLYKAYFDLCALAVLTAFGSMSYFSHQAMPFDLKWLLICMAVAWLGVLGGYLCMHQTASINFQRIVLWALAIRLVACFGAPVLDDSHYRILWDGYAFAQKGSPYSSIPLESFRETKIPERWQRNLDHIADPQLHADKGPLTECLLFWSYELAPGETWPLKIFYLFCDLLTIFALSLLVSPKQSLLYAWCPLLLFETYFNLHVEIFCVALVMLSVLHLFRRQHTRAAIVAGLAAAAHPFAWPVSLWVAWKTRGWERLLMMLCAGAAYLYFFVHDGTQVLHGASEYFSLEHFNGFLVALLDWKLPGTVAVGLSLSVFLILAVLWYQHLMNRPSDSPRFEWLYMALVASLPVVHPAIFLWVLPWAVIRPQVWTFLTFALISLSYCTGASLPLSHLRVTEHPHWVPLVESVSVLCAALLCWSLTLKSRDKSDGKAIE